MKTMKSMEGAASLGRSLQMRGPGNTRRTWMSKKVADAKKDIAEMKTGQEEVKKVIADVAEVEKETEEVKV